MLENTPPVNLNLVIVLIQDQGRQNAYCICKGISEGGIRDGFDIRVI